jgi:hypothetical protein
MATKANICRSDEYNTIKQFYGNAVAERSRVPLINHINESLMILDSCGADSVAKKAFCLHPIIQNKEKGVTVKSTTDFIYLCQEYSEKANSYLCKPETDYITTVEDVHKVVKGMSEQCLLMLLADKLQNHKDFVIYHKKTHARSENLNRYFNLWIEYLTGIA